MKKELSEFVEAPKPCTKCLGKVLNLRYCPSCTRPQGRFKAEAHLHVACARCHHETDIMRTAETAELNQPLPEKEEPQNEQPKPQRGRPKKEVQDNG